MISILFYFKTEMEYLGFWVTLDVVKTVNIKIGVITNMKPLTSQKQYKSLYV